MTTPTAFPYHPAYGLDDATRREVIQLVVEAGVPVKDVAALYRLCPSTVYRWLRDTNTNTLKES